MSAQHKAQSLAFILHRRNYGESSRILSCFTRDYGRIDAICKGCRKPGKQGKVLEPFRLYNLSWSGRSDLKTLVNVDEHNMFNIHADSNKLYCGLYLNELVNGLTRTVEAEPVLFDLYKSTLASLTENSGSMIQYILRYFELNMLNQMGYGISLDLEQDGVTPIDPDASYGFQPDHGFFRTVIKDDYLAQGDSILALKTGALSSPRQEREARSLTRLLIGYYLPDTKIQSRKLFVS